MILIDKEQLLSDIVNLKIPLGISSQDIDATYIDVDPIYVEGYCAGKSEMQSKIIDIINKQRVTELEKPKKRHKLKFMTAEECCNQTACQKCEYYDNTYGCYYAKFNHVNITCSQPYRKRNGKYILVEVENENYIFRFHPAEGE